MALSTCTCTLTSIHIQGGPFQELNIPVTVSVLNAGKASAKLREVTLVAPNLLPFISPGTNVKFQFQCAGIPGIAEGSTYLGEIYLSSSNITILNIHDRRYVEVADNDFK